MNPSRRKFLSRSVLATAGITASLEALAAGTEQASQSTENSSVPEGDKYSIHIFSKNLHWLEYDEMSTVVADMGFDGIDLTVRPEGHVNPDRVAEELPRAFAAMKRAGLRSVMITTAITDADEPYTESILKTAASLGIRYYRMGWRAYDNNIDIAANLAETTRKLKKLEALNKKYNIRGQYQNHSGTSFGSPVWDLGSVLKEINSPWLGSQYDILHATVEGSNSWPLGMKLLQPYIGTLDIKDFEWSKKDGQWKSATVPLGEGLVNYKKYFELIKAYKLEAPFSIHYEYPLGGAENGAKVITMKKEDVLAAMKKDLQTLKRWLIEAGIK